MILVEGGREAAALGMAEKCRNVLHCSETFLVWESATASASWGVAAAACPRSSQSAVVHLDNARTCIRYRTSLRMSCLRVKKEWLGLRSYKKRVQRKVNFRH